MPAASRAIRSADPTLFIASSATSRACERDARRHPRDDLNLIAQDLFLDLGHLLFLLFNMLVCLSGILF
jgi:hypothetical protein